MARPSQPERVGLDAFAARVRAALAAGADVPSEDDIIAAAYSAHEKLPSVRFRSREAVARGSCLVGCAVRHFLCMVYLHRPVPGTCGAISA